MMRLILVHGINQEKTDEAALREVWLKGLREVAGKAAWPAPVEVALPFYGKILADLTKAGKAGDAVAQGGGEDDGVSAESEEFAADYAAQLQARLGITDQQVNEAMAAPGSEIVVEQGPIYHNRYLKGVMKVVQAVSPFHGDVALKLLAQAHAYLKYPHVAKAVDAAVAPALSQPGPMVVIAHSLGTIVTYKLLREMGRAGKPADVALYLTLGSPLGIESVKKSLKPGLKKPGGVAQWVNGGDPDDFVALETRLYGIYGPEVRDLAGIRNGDDDKHSITDYLANKVVHAEVLKALP